MLRQEKNINNKEQITLIFTIESINYYIRATKTRSNDDAACVIH